MDRQIFWIREVGKANRLTLLFRVVQLSVTVRQQPVNPGLECGIIISGHRRLDQREDLAGLIKLVFVDVIACSKILFHDRRIADCFHFLDPQKQLVGIAAPGQQFREHNEEPGLFGCGLHEGQTVFQHLDGRADLKRADVDVSQLLVKRRRRRRSTSGPHSGSVLPHRTATHSGRSWPARGRPQAHRMPPFHGFVEVALGKRQKRFVRGRVCCPGRPRKPVTPALEVDPIAGGIGFHHRLDHAIGLGWLIEPIAIENRQTPRGFDLLRCVVRDRFPVLLCGELVIPAFFKAPSAEEQEIAFIRVFSEQDIQFQICAFVLRTPAIEMFRIDLQLHESATCVIASARSFQDIVVNLQRPFLPFRRIIHCQNCISVLDLEVKIVRKHHPELPVELLSLDKIADSPGVSAFFISARAVCLTWICWVYTLDPQTRQSTAIRIAKRLTLNAFIARDPHKE